MSLDISRVAIIGGGPAGCTLGRQLSKLGSDVTIFDSGKRPDLIVGESLIPAILPLLSELGLEDSVRKIGTHKPGASMFFPDGLVWRLTFSENEASGPHFAYNVPRKEFDSLFQEMAKMSGCNFSTEKVDTELVDKDLVGIVGKEKFSFIVDATGRNRVLPKRLSIPSKSGARKDVALFSHFNDAELPHGGNIHLGVSDLGWSWRIPLPGRVSIGIVAPNEYIQGFGATDEERFDRIVRQANFSGQYLKPESVRISGVARYSNYQLLSDRFFGANWALVGDSAGFIDPVFSGGAYLALWGAIELANALKDDDLIGYQSRYRAHLSAWQKLVDTFYDGRFFKSVRVAARLKESGRVIHGTKGLVCRIVSGISITNPEEISQFESLLNLAGQFNLASSGSAPSLESRSN